MNSFSYVVIIGFALQFKAPMVVQFGSFKLYHLNGKWNNEIILYPLVGRKVIDVLTYFM